MTSRQIITIALSAAGLVCAALIVLLVLDDLSAPTTEPGPEPTAAPAALGGAPESVSREPQPREPQPEPEPEPRPAVVEQAPAPPKLVPPGSEPQPPRPAQPTIWGDNPPSPVVAPSYGAGG